MTWGSAAASTMAYALPAYNGLLATILSPSFVTSTQSEMAPTFSLAAIAGTKSLPCAVALQKMTAGFTVCRDLAQMPVQRPRGRSFQTPARRRHRSCPHRTLQAADARASAPLPMTHTATSPPNSLALLATSKEPFLISPF